MINDFDIPPFNNKEDIPCRVCAGLGEGCPCCGDSGVEEVSRGEADFEREQRRYDDYYERFSD